MSARDINLAIFHDPLSRSAEDMEAIAAHIRERDAGIRVLVFSTEQPHTFTPLRLLARPTVTVEFDRPAHFNLIRGRRLRQLPMGKLASNQQLQAAGLPVPECEVIMPATRLDPAVWGPYVVVKPDRGCRGAYVWVHRTGRVRYKAPAELPEDHPGRQGVLYAERFIYTGPYPVSYRVLTLFGEPLAATRSEGRHDQAPLAGATAFREAAGVSVVATASGCTISLTDDAEVLALARRVHAVFPTVPVLGQDIVREAATGKLYVLETNPGGGVWTFSNRSGRKMQAEFGLDFYRQFDGMRAAARVLTEVARRFAR